MCWDYPDLTLQKMGTRFSQLMSTTRVNLAHICLLRQGGPPGGPDPSRRPTAASQRAGDTGQTESGCSGLFESRRDGSVCSWLTNTLLSLSGSHLLPVPLPARRRLVRMDSLTAREVNSKPLSWLSFPRGSLFCLEMLPVGEKRDQRCAAAGTLAGSTPRTRRRWLSARSRRTT